MMDFELGARLAAAQRRIFDCIDDELREDPMHKSYEGAIDVTFSLPNRFSSDPPEWTITLHAYVLRGMDGRHEDWSARTLHEAIAIAEAGIDRICRPYEFRRFAEQMDKICDSETEMAGGESYGPMRHEDADGRAMSARAAAKEGTK